MNRSDILRCRTEEGSVTDYNVRKQEESALRQNLQRS